MQKRSNKVISTQQIKTKLIIWYFIVISLSVLFLGIGSYFILYNSLASACETDLVNSSNYSLSLYENTQQYAMHAVISDTASSIRANSGSASNAHKLRTEFQNTIISNNNIASVFLYTPDNDSLYIFGNQQIVLQKEHYPDQEGLQQLLDAENTVPISQDLLCSTYLTKKEVYFTSVHQMLGGDVCVINYDPMHIFSAFQRLSQVNTGEQFTFILDTNGKLIYHTDGLDIGSYFEKAKTILETTKASTSVIKRIDGNLYLMLYLQPQNAPWTILTIEKLTNFLSPLSSLLSLYVCFLIIGLIFIAIFIKPASKYLSTPFHQILSTLDTQYEPNEAVNIELRMLLDRITEIKHQLTASAKGNAFSQQQQAKLLSLLKQSDITAEAFYHRCEQASLPFHPEDRVKLLYVTYLEETTGKSQSTLPRDLFSFSFMNVLNELCPNLNVTHSLDIHDGALVFFAFPTSELSNSTYSDVFQQIHVFFMQHFSVSVFCGFSQQLNVPAELPSIYRSIHAICYDYQYFHPETAFLFLQQNMPQQEAGDFVHFSSIQQLRNALAGGKMDLSNDLITAYIQKLKSLSKQAAVSSLSAFCVQLHSIITELENTYSPLPDSQALFNAVISAPSLEVAQNYLLEAIQNICETVSNKAVGLREQKFKQVLRKIDASYHDYNLSAKTMADDLDISVVTLNRLFKQNANCSMMAYVKNLRLHKACELLLNTNSSVEYIAKSVGFENTKYFHTCFKQMYDMTPTSYRTLNCPTEYKQGDH